MKVVSFGITDLGLRRTINEDNFFRSDELGLYLVADGMGGHAAGEVASGAAIESIAEFFQRHADDSSLTWPFGYDARLSPQGNAVVSGIRLANTRVLGLQADQPELSGMGTTIVGMQINGTDASIAHVGDSRIYRLRDDKFELLTSDHSWVNEQLQKNLITAEEARNHRFRNVITRALGNRQDLEVDVAEFTVLTGDTYLLCSDGLSGKVDDDVLHRIVSLIPDLRECANRLVSLANEAGGEDNITVVLIRMLADDEEYPPKKLAGVETVTKEMMPVDLTQAPTPRNTPVPPTKSTASTVIAPDAPTEPPVD